jgi:amino acid adenylation domain-containing protein
MPPRSNSLDTNGVVLDLIAEQARARPDALAVAFGADSLTYADLDSGAESVAAWLRNEGITAEQLVGICADRSIAMIVAILGVLKAGGAYLPLDPQYPSDRLAFMVEQARASLVLAQHGTENLFAGTGVRVEGLEGARAATDGRVLPRRPAVSPRGLAYVIFTSGSTGRPKGVMIEHRGLLNLALAQAEAFGVAASSRVLQFASTSFDASVSEMFSTFVAGGTLYLLARDELLPGALEQALRRLAISVVTLPPSLLTVLSSDALPDLRTVVSAGEACTPEIVRRWAVGRRFINAYGPTETTVCVTLGDISVPERAAWIGRPIRNVRAVVLDALGNPVGTDAVGELWVGGVGVARGYVGRPDLTAERFRPDSSGGLAGERLYRTGDQVRKLENGLFEYVGRIDDQIKVRGYRIEPAEIESLLVQQPGVSQAVVLLREDQGGNASLVAYVCSEGATTPDVSGIREALQAKLPGYMIPNAFVTLSEWPRTPTGKVDRQALPAPDAADLPQRGRAPRGPIEEKIAEIWRGILDMDVVGAEEDFFWLGGHSLLAAQMLAEAGVAIGVELSFGILFSTEATVASLAQRVCTEIVENSDQKTFEDTYGWVEGLSEEKAESLLAAFKWDGDSAPDPGQ